jgi:RND family efflux transporter MFP subunit
MIRKLATILGTIGIVFGGIVLIGLMGKMRPKIEPKEAVVAPVAVFYQVAEAKPVQLTVRAQGEVKARTDISLTAEVGGKIVKTAPAFVDGGAFKAGELLLKIEDADYKVAVAAARARVAQAQEGLSREQAEADLAASEYEALKRDEDPSELALRKPQLAQARAAYESARADLSAAQLNLQRTEIRAPFDGRVRQRQAGPGQYVGPGMTIGRIFSTDVAEVRLPLSDYDLSRLGMPIAFNETTENPGPQVLLSATVAGGYHEWKGRIARTDGAIDPSTRQISAIAVVDDPYGKGSDQGVPLAVGLFVDAAIDGAALGSAIVLPRTALYGRDTVYVIAEGDILEQRTVRVAADSKETVTIDEGLKSGDRIVTSPLRGAGPGAKVAPTVQTAPLAQRAGDATPVAAEAALAGGKL